MTFEEEPQRRIGELRWLICVVLAGLPASPFIEVRGPGQEYALGLLCSGTAISTTWAVFPRGKALRQQLLVLLPLPALFWLGVIAVNGATGWRLVLPPLIASAVAGLLARLMATRRPSLRDWARYAELTSGD
jgi:hypothetical protein